MTQQEARKKGGMATAQKYGPNHMREIARRGGLRTAERYGSSYMAQIGQKGAATFYERYEVHPAFQSQWAIIDKATRKLVTIY